MDLDADLDDAMSSVSRETTLALPVATRSDDLSHAHFRKQRVLTWTRHFLPVSRTQRSSTNGKCRDPAQTPTIALAANGVRSIAAARYCPPRIRLRPGAPPELGDEPRLNLGSCEVCPQGNRLGPDRPLQ